MVILLVFECQILAAQLEKLKATEGGHERHYLQTSRFFDQTQYSDGMMGKQSLKTSARSLLVRVG